MNIWGTVLDEKMLRPDLKRESMALRGKKQQYDYKPSSEIR
jgi:hypothetical protein